MRIIARFGEDKARGIPRAAEVWTMATRETGGQKSASRQDRETEEVEVQASDAVKERHEKLSDDVDAILDEIDEVLEENAEEFVRSYVQKGGE